MCFVYCSSLAVSASLLDNWRNAIIVLNENKFTPAAVSCWKIQTTFLCTATQLAIGKGYEQDF